MDLGLKGKVAIVTGPAKGMGAAITLALAREGVDLCLAGRDMAAVAPVTKQVLGMGRKAIEVQCDVTEPAQIEAMVKKALDAFGGRIDILVNVAGGRGPLETTAWETTPEQFDQIVELNMKGCYLTMRAVTPTMQKQRSGKIVNIGGTFGLRGRALRMAYSASKWGLRGITKAFALELGPYAINVNNVCPGMVDGPRFRKVCAEKAKKDIDATGKDVIPGAIDSHVHFPAPGYDHKEDWQTGTGSAARGGVTTVLEMPNTNPPTGTLEALKIKQGIAACQAYVDYGIYGLLDENNLGELEALAAAGVSSFKCFMGNTFGDLPAPSDGAMPEGFEIRARLGLRCTVHAENASIMARRQAQLEAARRTDPPAHLAARPEVCAIEAVSRAVVFAEWTGARLHIAHKSSKDALYVLRDAKRRGVDVTVETCPQYLLLSTEDHKRLGNVLRVNPPIREPGHQAPLWQGLRPAAADTIPPHPPPH